MVVLAITVIVAKYSSIHYDETGWQFSRQILTYIIMVASYYTMTPY